MAVLSFRPLKTSLRFLPASVVSDEKYSIFTQFRPNTKASCFSVAALKDPCLQFLEGGWWWVLAQVSLGLYHLGFVQLLESVGLCLLPNLREIFSAVISLTIFFSLPTPPPVSSPSGTLMAHMWDLLWYCTRSPGSDPPPQSSPSLLFERGNFCCSVFKFTESFLFPPCSAVEPSVIPWSPIIVFFQKN